MIFGLVPAAGKSQRMGRPKLALKIGNQTVLEHVIAALVSGGADVVLVVLSPRPEHEGLQTLALNTGAQVLVLPQETPHMRATALAGLDWLEAHYEPQPTDAWLLAPADHPTMDPQVVRQLIETKNRLPADAIVVPTHDGKRGHPTLIGWPHVAPIRRFPADLGLSSYFRQCASVTELEVSADSILHDLDTPADYARFSDQ